MSASPIAADQACAAQKAHASRVRGHREMLILALLVGVSAPLLRVYPAERVGWRWSPDLVLPPLCAVRAYCGVDCPGCGLTRSFVYLAHGDVEASWRMHRLGGLLAALILLQIPYRLLAMRQPQRRLLPALATIWIAPVLLVLFFVNWLYNLLTTG